MKIMLAAGGTGGHINPALALAGEIRRRDPDAQILFVGAKDKMEARLVPEAGYDFAPINISGFYRQLTIENIERDIATFFKMFIASHQAKKLIKSFKPDVVVGFGGYVSGPVVRKAAKMGVATAIHEQNAFPGKANKALAKIADRVMLTTADAEKYLDAKNGCIVTGLPVRGEMLKADRAWSRKELGVKDGQIMVLSMGGSLGAQAINEAMVKLIATHYKNENLFFMHAMGQYGLWVPDELKKSGVDPEKANNIVLREYINDMDRCMAAADLVISRSGASTIAELEAVGRASILIPSPNVAENHQYYNALSLAKNDAAIVIEEKSLTEQKMNEAFVSLISDTERLKQAGENAKNLSVENAVGKIADIVIELTKKQ